MLYRWSGEAMVPLPRDLPKCQQENEVGRVYRLDKVEPRSQKSHDHFFSVLTEAWETLPEHLAERFPSVESLRKWALVKSGHCDVRTYVASTKAEAARIAGWLHDEYAVVTYEDRVVTVFTPHSQSRGAMSAKQFQKSKDDVFRVVAELTGTDPSNYGRAA